MAILNVYRNSYQQSRRWEDIIRKVWNDEAAINRLYCKCNPYNADTIIHSFKMIHSSYSNFNSILVHCFSIDFESVSNMETMVRIINEVLMLYGESFQIIAVLSKKDDRYVAAFVLNAVSYKTGRKFHDNNRAYIELMNHLKNLFQLEIRCSIAEPVLFTDGPAAGNYTNILGKE